jgi:ribosomal protein L37E
MSDDDSLSGPRLNAVVKEIGYEDGQITRLVFVNEDDGEQWRLEGEMEVVDPYDDEAIPDGGGSVGGDRPDDHTPPRQRPWYWVECRYCGEETYDLERRCVRCGKDRQAHREPENRDPDRRRMPDGGGSS